MSAVLERRCRSGPRTHNQLISLALFETKRLARHRPSWSVPGSWCTPPCGRSSSTGRVCRSGRSRRASSSGSPAWSRCTGSPDPVNALPTSSEQLPCDEPTRTAALCLASLLPGLLAARQQRRGADQVALRSSRGDRRVGVLLLADQVALHVGCVLIAIGGHCWVSRSRAGGDGRPHAGRRRGTDRVVDPLLGARHECWRRWWHMTAPFVIVTTGDGDSDRLLGRAWLVVVARRLPSRPVRAGDFDRIRHGATRRCARGCGGRRSDSRGRAGAARVQRALRPRRLLVREPEPELMPRCERRCDSSSCVPCRGGRWRCWCCWPWPGWPLT